MSITAILTLVLVLVLSYFLLQYFLKDAHLLLQNVSSAKMEQTVNTAGVDLTSGNFFYSIWFYVDDFNYRYSEPKLIFGRLNSDNDPCISLVLAPTKNDLICSLSVYPDKTVKSCTTTPSDHTVQTTTLSNIPLQSWNNVIISIYGRSLDFYLNGKLCKTTMLSGVTKQNATTPIILCGNGGFSGYISRFVYWPIACNPQKAAEIYSHGYSGSYIGEIFGKYGMQFSLISDGQINSSITI